MTITVKHGTIFGLPFAKGRDEFILEDKNSQFANQLLHLRLLNKGIINQDFWESVFGPSILAVWSVDHWKLEICVFQMLKQHIKFSEARINDALIKIIEKS